MPKYIITEGSPLKGRIKVSGAKNSVLPIIAASLLADEQGVIEEVPYLNDVKVMCDLLGELGAEVKFIDNNEKLVINPEGLYNETAPYELVNKMRASFLIMGPLLAKLGVAKIPLPGGCAIGSRPVDLHLKGFSAMGAEIIQKHGYIEAKTRGKLKGNKVYLDFPSVGATENIMMAATLAEGQTIIENAAIEPEIVDLATYLTAMGADIKGAGTDTIKINGVSSLKGVSHAIIPDRIEAGTYMVAAAITGGDVVVENVVPDHLKPITAKLREAGVVVIEEPTSIHIAGRNCLKSVDIKTHPYPGFPTDMQSQMTSLMCTAEGTSIIIETIFENRFMYVNELKRMGANIKIEGRSAVVEGKPKLLGARVKATDLRAGAALILAGLAAEGVTEITDIEHIERGYVNIDGKLRSLGVNIVRSDDD
ncbi:UDP-N-acetylglucosamine 1-carboxyvinyltransferase [Clostridium thermosuccinogenes]|uniref:UDP-N-acetylglucosamine 1-carboxyvinyltransferase n=1 Tax=Clostridium thermosuccinogenes TaxID=84032 RepID=A0A2K2FFQ6_9CLOT|nr:UDP-N-acetylglucosamine 1-carboxyvinyltransferase [Pseudoclostridium thermosuccinogenes]AUS95008.1 UDP-N-acetylglucosamine 1-carboxyvinyltransferase [Pseudoclostridium thermosuccinogenes]PNT96041.1 UDP-N-acetylglucosamine 1-carboxyvinyltransferase [Pseudoclostridium thermosuccinogenes]PNT97602.1 UDP-N-acetylglucosamine 1-carboxyvinyltransferase [Pseudoclostridium thermosuccinogenes]